LWGFALVFISLLISGWAIQPPAGAPGAAYKGETAEPSEIPGGPPLPGASPTPLMANLEKPPLPENPTLADHGAQVYWWYCMACHGGKGQGLTDEWRESAFGEDMNCWTSRCHASNHPPEGFEFPRQVPSVIGANTLRRFTTADDLQKYIRTTMPWWSPGLLTDEESWQLTAFLLRENGYLARGADFNPKNAASVPVHLPVRTQSGDHAGVLALVGALGLAILTIVGGNLLLRNSTDDSAPLRAPRASFFHHLHPPTIPLPQARWRYTLGAGGLAVFLAAVLGITGILEMFFYIPTPEQAGMSIQSITFEVPYGALVRGIHFWAAQGLVVVSVIHLIRVIFTGAFVPPRRFNYLLGLGLLVLILLLNFTGYVLRWDEGIRWALVVGTNLLNTIPLIGERVYGFVVGGSAPGLATLTRFYAWHIFGLTSIVIFLVGWHAFRVRRDGGIAVPAPEHRPDPSRITRSELVRREVLAMLVATFVLIMVGLFIPAPLDAPIFDASTGAPLQDVRAPWFFLWVQQLLRFGDAFWLGIFVPLALVGIFAAIPYIIRRIPEEQKGRWFPRAGLGAQILVATVILGWLALTILELLE
jgi:quinol-cytochrome oxidoreductase complex cytochrome b subunit/mono/diheme cytochrome c family protein